MSEAKVPPAPTRRAPARKRKRKIVRESWTAEKKATFLATLAATCNVSAAVRSISLPGRPGWPVIGAWRAVKGA